MLVIESALFKHYADVLLITLMLQLHILEHHQTLHMSDVFLLSCIVIHASGVKLNLHCMLCM